MRVLANLFVVAALGAVGFACAESGEEEGVPEGATTFHEDVQPILEKSCSACHSEGGVAPFSLGTYEEVVDLAPAVLDSIESGRMPPWPPQEGCGDFHGARVMAAQDKAAIAAWVEGGMHEGIAPAGGDEASGQSEEIDPPDLLLGASDDYVPDPSRPDDYRCFVLDHDFEKGAFLTSVQVIPDKEAMVHHVLLFLVRKSDTPKLSELDGADEEVGYTCFGGPGAGPGITLGGWAPGGVPPEKRDGAAMVVPAGSKLVMQIHYNLVALEKGAEIEGDRTQVGLWLLQGEETPEFQLEIRPLANGSIAVPANEPSSTHVLDYTFTADTMVVGVTPHMHLLGKSIKLELIREGEDDQCMVYIPEWDFSWQQFYNYSEDGWFQIRKGDRLRQTCEYDNGPENQPVVNGSQQDSRDVFWGDGSLDEMCLNYITVMRPYNPDGEDSSRCEGFHLCAEYCAEDDALCFFACSMAQGLGCTQCTVQSTVTCGLSACETEAKGLLGCMGACEDVGAGPTCFMHACFEEYGNFYACMKPQILSGICDEKLAGCGVSALEGGP